MAGVGLDAKFYHGVAGAVPSTEMTNCKDLTLNQEIGTSDSTKRGDKWRKKLTTLFDGSLEWEMVWETGDAGFVAVKDAFYNRTSLALMALDVEGGAGLDGDWVITSFTRNEPMEEVLTVNVKAEPSGINGDREPAWTE